MGFFSSSKKGSSFSLSPNPLKPKFRGGGTALGGARPGELVQVTFPAAGPLGCSIEKDHAGSAVVSSVAPGSQAAAAGLLRGDVVCWGGCGGEEAGFEEFMEVVRGGERPLCVEVKRLSTVAAPAAGGSAAADARKAAMVAAATRREEEMNKKRAPRSAARRAIDLDNNTKTYDHAATSAAPQTEETRRAVAAVKLGERKLAAELGYNPFEAVKSGAGGKGAAGKVGEAVAAGSEGSDGSAGPEQVAKPEFPNGTDGDEDVPDEFTL